MNPLEAVQFIRQGDNVFLVNMAAIEFDPFDLASFKRESNRWQMVVKHYECPFSILDEFRMWWEWHYRRRVQHKKTGHIAYELGLDPERMKAHEIPVGVMLNSYFGNCDATGWVLKEPRAIFCSTTA